MSAIVVKGLHRQTRAGVKKGKENSAACSMAATLDGNQDFNRPAWPARPMRLSGFLLVLHRWSEGICWGWRIKIKSSAERGAALALWELVLPAMQTPRSTLHRVDPIAGKTGSHKSSAGVAAMAADCPLQKAEWRCLEESATSPHRLDKLTLHTPDNPQTPFLLSVIRPRL